MPGSLVLWHVSESSLGSWVIRNPYFWHNNAPKIQIKFHIHGNREFSIISSCQLKQLMHFCFSPSDGLIWGRISCLKKLRHINVTWLPESSNDGILFLPHPMCTIGHVATALCITLILIWAETCWLEVFPIKPTIPLSLLIWLFQSGPQTLSPSDWSKVWGAIIFLSHEDWYYFYRGLLCCCHLFLGL